MSDEEDQVEILRKEFWRLEKAAAAPTAPHAAKANLERRREIEADLRALRSDTGDREDYDPGFASR